MFFATEAAYLLIRAVLVMFYGAGANKDICAVEKKKGNGVSMENLEQQHGKNTCKHFYFSQQLPYA